MRKFFSVVAFVLGCGGAFWFSWIHLDPIITQYQLIPSLLASSEVKPLEFACKEVDCVTCLQGMRDTPRGIIFTGGSAFRYALDFDEFSGSMPAPVVNCIKNDSRVDAYRSFFTHAQLNQPSQVLLHGYNSWAVNSAGTWAGDHEATFFVVTYPPRPADPNRQVDWKERIFGPVAYRQYIRAQDRVSLVLLYAHIFLTRGATQGPYEWRFALRLKSDSFRNHDLSFWPLSRSEHLRRRLILMRHWFSLSAYASSFMMDAGRLRPAAEIAERHEQFIQSVAPTSRIVFFPAPELTDAFPDDVKTVLGQAKTVLLQTLLKHPSVRHVEVDYQACGMVSSDFWHEGLMIFDIPHANNEARAKLNKCITDALLPTVADPQSAP